MTGPTGGRGGYHPPAHPAPASGPGAASQRTDGGPGQPIKDIPNADYGEQQVFHSAQAGAPMAQAPGPAGPPGGAPAPGPDLSGVTGLGEPTARPGEPVTSGAALGPGPGPASLGLGSGPDAAGIQYLKNSLPTLELMSSMPMATTAFRNLVRRLRAAA